MGEEMCVFIRLGDGEDCDAEEVRDYCRDKVRQQGAASVRSLLCPSHTLKAAALLLSDGRLQNSSLRPFCHQFPHQLSWEGEFIQL